MVLHPEIGPIQSTSCAPSTPPPSLSLVRDTELQSYLDFTAICITSLVDMPIAIKYKYCMSLIGYMQCNTSHPLLIQPSSLAYFTCSLVPASRWSSAPCFIRFYKYFFHGGHVTVPSLKIPVATSIEFHIYFVAEPSPFYEDMVLKCGSHNNRILRV